MIYLIVYSSITSATRVKKIMNSLGESVSIIQTPKSIPVNDCSYSIKVLNGQLKIAIQNSQKYGFKSRGVYEQIGENEFREV